MVTLLEEKMYVCVPLIFLHTLKKEGERVQVFERRHAHALKRERETHTHTQREREREREALVKS